MEIHIGVNMKKLDYIIIIFIFIFSLGIYGVYFYYKGLGSDQLKVEIRYQNEILASYDFVEGLDKDIYIDFSDGQLNWTVKSKGVIELEESVAINNSTHEQTHNVVHLAYKDIYMTEADCHGGQCLRMKIFGSFSPPIYCTNGVTVSLTETEIEIIV